MLTSTANTAQGVEVIIWRVKTTWPHVPAITKFAAERARIGMMVMSSRMQVRILEPSHHEGCHATKERLPSITN